MPDNVTLTEMLARVLANLPQFSDSASTELLYRLLVAAMYFAIAALGAALAELFTARVNPHSTLNFWKRMFPRSSAATRIRLDFLAKVLGGAIIALAFVGPQSERQALAAGVGWAGALAGYLSASAARGTLSKPEPIPSLAEEPSRAPLEVQK